MRTTTFRSTLVALPVLAAFGCSNTPAGPNPSPSPTVKSPATEAPVALGDLSSFQRAKGDLLPSSLRTPSKLVKGVYGTGAVYKWSAVAATDVKKMVPSYVTELRSSKMYFAPETIGADGSHEIGVPIDSATETKIYVIPRGAPKLLAPLKLADLKLDIVQPSGTKLLVSSPDVHVLDFEGVGDDEIAPIVGNKFSSVKLDKPTTGMHTMRFVPTATIENVGAVVLTSHGVELSAIADRHSVITGEQVVVRAKVAPADGQTVATATVKAKIITKTGATFTTITMHDDGVGADKVAGDHEFAGEFTPESDDMADTGFWTAMIEARGTTSAGAPYLRHVSTGVGVSFPLAKLGGKVTERRGDVEGTSCFQFVVTVETSVASRYRLRAIVTTPTGDAVAETITSLELPKGAGRVVLAVPQKYLEGKGSSFKLADLQLVSMDTEFPVARLADAYVTKTNFVK